MRARAFRTTEQKLRAVARTLRTLDERLLEGRLAPLLALYVHARTRRRLASAIHGGWTTAPATPEEDLLDRLPPAIRDEYVYLAAHSWFATLDLLTAEDDPAARHLFIVYE